MLNFKRGVTPLHLAVRNGHYSLAEKLIQDGADKEIKDYEGFTPMDYMKAAQTQNS